MKKKWMKQLISLALAGITIWTVPVWETGTAYAAGKVTSTAYDGTDGQPKVSHYFPEELLKWNKNTDTDLPYNISYIPLSKRAKKENLKLSNDTQNKNAKLLVISSLNASTSGNDSQGSNEFMKKGTNMYSYWQYADTLVYWGGSAGEGIVVPPSADVIDEAHRNGVPVLGTVFFAPSVYGGKLEWVKQMLQKEEDGSFPAADKLIELARTIHFDGWFINQETEGTDAKDAKALQEMIQYMKKQAPELKIYYYDAMTQNGAVDWQNALTDKNKMYLKDEAGQNVADAMFLNFWWTNNSQKDKELLKVSNEKAKEIGVNPYDIYAGVDVEANGYGTPIRWNLFEKEGNATQTSLGLFKPSWTYESAAGDTKEEKEVDFSEKESRFWVNEFGDPSKTTQAQEMEWKGMSHYFVENTPITKAPFLTNFSMGQGKAYYIDGRKVSDREWNNRSMQDVMPTYRFIINNEGSTKLKGCVDYDIVYQGGSSLGFEGNLSAKDPAVIKLFASDVLTATGTEIAVTARSEEPVKMDLVLELSNDTNVVLEGKNEIKGWQKETYQLGKYVGLRIRNISLRFTSEKDQNANINVGAFSILNGKGNTITPDTPKIKGVYSEDGITAGIRLDLGNKKDGISYYEIYRVTENKKKELYGVTVNPDYYLGDIKREGKQSETTFEIKAVSETGSRSKAQSVTMKWGSYPKPTAGFTVDKTYVVPGSKVQFTNLSSVTTENLVWTFTGADIKTSTDTNPVVTYNKAGIYSVTLTASNTSGESKDIRTDYIVVNEKAADIKNLAFEKPTSSSSFVSENEADKYAVDDSIKTKWCAVGEGPHTITIDLEKESLISEIKISHAEAGGEGSGYNTKAFSIYAGNDGETFTKIGAVTDNEAAVSNTPIKPVKARYVKIIIDKATQGGDMAARIYDIQVSGTN